MQKIKETTAYKKALRGRILEAAMKAFTERGIKAVRMDDISQILSISKRTVYEIFADKEELLYQGVIYYDQEAKKAMAEIVAKAPSVMDIILEAYQRRVARSASVNPLFYEDIQKYAKVTQYLDNERKRTHGQFINFLQRGVGEGYFRSGLDYELVAEMFNAINRYVMTQHLLSHYTKQQLFENMLLVPLRGFCTEKGLKVLEKSFKTQ